MRAEDPKQAVIQAITASAPQSIREKMGMVAKPESIHFLKEKNLQHIYVCAVSYTSTNGQKWYIADLLTQGADGLFRRNSEVSCKAENRFLSDKETHAMYQHQPWLHISGGGTGSATPMQSISANIAQETTEGGIARKTMTIGGVSPANSARDVSGYRFWVGYLTTNGYPVARVRMIPAVGAVEEDEVLDDTVLFLSKCSGPLTFEFYSPSNTLIAAQRIDVP